MRRFKLQVQASLDGFMAGPQGEMDWMTLPWSQDLDRYVTDLTDNVDCIMLGRKLAEGFIPHWASQPEGEDPAGVEKMNVTPKVVISTTIADSPWPNTIVEANLAQTVRSLKAADGGDIIAYGGGTLVTSLLSEYLVDDIYLFVNPVALGSGMPIFPLLEVHQPFRQVSATSFDCGVTALHLSPSR